MRVRIDLKESSTPLEFDGVRNTYTKGPLFVVYGEDDSVVKIPLDNIWRVIESPYTSAARR